MQYKKLKTACYFSGLTMSVTANLSPILFITFRTLYGISFSLLGFLVFINFVTQLLIDLAFSFFGHKFNIEKTVKTIPIISTVGMLIFSLTPFLFKGHEFLGLAAATVIFSLSAGFGEVLTSPLIAAIPAKDPDREMSKLHSFYAWGVVGVAIISTLFLLLFGGEYWYILSLLLTLIPFITVFLFYKAPIPPMETPKKTSGVLKHLKNKLLWLSVLAIFFGGASECIMAQWASGYLEKALQIPKVWGDIIGVSMFSVFLGLGRTLYARYGRSLERILLFGAVAATVCYLVTALTDIALIGLIACAFTGFATSLLWPGNLSVASERFPYGVFIYALMAAGGDLGASVGVQLVGIVTDGVIANYSGVGQVLQPEQLGMRAGMLVALLFPLISIVLQIFIIKTKKKGTE
jgi:MFS family permease